MSDQPTNEDLAKAAVAADLADDQTDEVSAEEQAEAEAETQDAIQSAYDKAVAENPNFSATDMYSRVNTAYGIGEQSVIRQNPVTFADDIARNKVPAGVTDPRSDAEAEKGEERDENSALASTAPGGNQVAGQTPEEVVANDSADDGAANSALGAQSKGANFDGATSESLAEAGEDLGGGETPGDGGDDAESDEADPAEKSDEDLSDDDYNSVTVAQLKERLDARGTEYPSSATKADLWKLVTGRDHQS